MRPSPSAGKYVAHYVTPPSLIAAHMRRCTWPAAFLREGAVRQQLQRDGVPLVRAAPSRGVRHHREADLAAHLLREGVINDKCS